MFRERNVPAAKAPLKEWCQTLERTLRSTKRRRDLADSREAVCVKLPYTSSRDLEKLFSRYGRGSLWLATHHAQGKWPGPITTGLTLA